MQSEEAVIEAPKLTGQVAKAAALVTEIFKRRVDSLQPRDPRRPTSLYASRIPDCERQGVYEFTHYKDKSPFTWELHALFGAGNINEDAYKVQLRELGFKLVEDGAPLSDDMRLKYNIGGYLDWRIQWEGSKFVFEAKMMNQHVFDSIDGLTADILKSGEITPDMIERGVASMKKFIWTRKYLRQLYVYELGTHEEVAIFALTDGRGRWKFVIVPIDYEEAERILKIAERIKGHVESQTLPDRIQFDPQVCGKCAFLNICIPDIEQDAKLKIIDNKQLSDLLEVRDAHLESWRKVEKIDKAIKAFFENVKDGVFTIGNWIVQRKAENRTNYDIPDAIKQKYARLATIYKNKFARIANRSAEEIHIIARRMISFDDE